ncbi:hypothetical protein M3Y94_00486400 [Aphelenchoides besseyi]|nr:hypothetical protein M3Y94_00486400 [Aphelenchoides besseyi]
MDALDCGPVVAVMQVGLSFRHYRKQWYQFWKTCYTAKNVTVAFGHAILVYGYNYTCGHNYKFYLCSSWGTGWFREGYGCPEIKELKRVRFNDQSGLLISNSF